jgi:hypothetical protein
VDKQYILKNICRTREEISVELLKDFRAIERIELQISCGSGYPNNQDKIKDLQLG